MADPSNASLSGADTARPRNPAPTGDLPASSLWAQFWAMFQLRIRLFQSDPFSALPLFGFPVLFGFGLLYLASGNDTVAHKTRVTLDSPYHHFVTFAPSYVAGGSADPVAIQHVLSGANSSIMALRKQRFNESSSKANSVADIQVLSKKYASFYNEKREGARPDDLPPFGGFMLHAAPTAKMPSSPLNFSVVANPNPNLMDWSLHIPQLMINAVLNGMQTTLPPGPSDAASVPPIDVLAEAAALQAPNFNFRPPPPGPEDKDVGMGMLVAAPPQGAAGGPGAGPPNTNNKDVLLPTGPGDFGPAPLTQEELKRVETLLTTFNASSYAQAARQVIERYQRDTPKANDGSLALPPWSILVNGTVLPYELHPSEAQTFLSIFAPPMLVMSIFFIMLAATRNMTAERVEGQFAYFVTNGLSPVLFYLSTIAVYLFIIACGLVIVLVFFSGAQYMSPGLTVLLLLVFCVAVLLQSATLSFVFDDKQLVPSVLFLLIILGSVGPQIMYHLLKIKSLPPTTTTVLYILFPSFAVNKCFLEMVLINSGMGVYRPFAPGADTNYILTLSILAGHILFFFVTTVLLARSSSRDPLGTRAGSWLPSCFASQASSAKDDDEESMKATGIPKDPYLIAEKERIRSGADADSDVVRIQGLSMAFRGHVGKVLDDLWFSVRKNEVFAFLGPNGAGKSTTINILTGQLKALQGTATVCGKHPSDPAIKRLFGLCPQYDHVYKVLSVEDHLRAFAAIKGVPAKDVNMAVDQAIADAMLEDFKFRKVKELSGGTRRRLTIAIACLGRPAVVILDEPTTGVDVATRRTIWDMIQRLKTHSSVMLISHDLEEAERLSQRAGIMINGSLVCLGTPSRLKSFFGAAYVLKMQFVYGLPSGQLDTTLAEIQAKVSAYVGPTFVPRVRLVHRGESSMEISLDMVDKVGREGDEEARAMAQTAFLGDMLGFVTDKRSSWNVRDFVLAELTLTELFVRLAQHHRSYQDEEAVKY